MELNEDMITRFLKLLPAIQLIDPEVMFPEIDPRSYHSVDVEDKFRAQELTEQLCTREDTSIPRPVNQGRGQTQKQLSEIQVMEQRLGSASAVSSLNKSLLAMHDALIKVQVAIRYNFGANMKCSFQSYPELLLVYYQLPHVPLM